jgi:hypothetical protein
MVAVRFDVEFKFLKREAVMKMITVICTIFILILSVGCVKRQYLGVRPEGPFDAEKSFVSVDSCQPLLSWKSLDRDVSYDVVVYEALQKKSNLPIARGAKVFYAENIKNASVKVEDSLASTRKYLWSVRARSSDGRTTAWSSYNENKDNFISYTYRLNAWFGFETPECDDGNQVTEASEEIYEKIHKGRILTDENITKLLSNGYAGMVFRVRGYEYNEEDVSRVETDTELEKMMAEKMKHHSPAKLTMNVLLKGTSKEIEIKPNDHNVFVLIGPPGEYIVSRIIEKRFSGAYLSHRIFGEVTLKPGKLSYLGDVISFKKNRLMGNAVRWIGFTNLPKTFSSYFDEKFPNSANYLNKESITLGTDEGKKFTWRGLVQEI